MARPISIPCADFSNLAPTALILRIRNAYEWHFLRLPNSMQDLDALLRELISKAKVRDAPNYYYDYPGFQAAFRVPLLAPPADLRIVAPNACAELAADGDGRGLASEIGSALGPLILNRSSYDVLFIYLPDAWEQAFKPEGFDLHHQLKAQLAPSSVAVQIVKEKTERRDRAQVMWGISVALYAKAGGIPWKLADHNRDEAYIGLSYAMKPRRDGADYTTCCSQVFDPDGTGFEFVAFDTRDYTTDRQGNPFLSYVEMQAVLSKSLLLYQNGHRGRTPRKIYVHKSTPFTSDEILGAHDAFGHRTELELIQIIRSNSWYGLKLEAPRGQGEEARPAQYPVDRGLYLPISSTECLLWTQGSVTDVHPTDPRRPVFKDAPLKPLPHPILLRRHSGESGWHDTCHTMLALTKVDWNNNTLYKTIPATLVYSSLFAEVVKNSPEIVDQVYDYRCFM